MISCGNAYTIAIKMDRTIWTWGYNAEGQLGNGGGGNLIMTISSNVLGLNNKEFANQSVPICLKNLTASVKPLPPKPTQPTTPAQPAGPEISSWAKDPVDKAVANNLVADGLGNDYRVNITRAQFAATAVKLYEAMSGQAIPAAGNSPFTDTSDPAVIQAQALGFVNGVGNNQFAPDALVTREQAASMLSRVYTKLGGNIPTVTATSFADNNLISNWARDAVAFMANEGIVNDTGNNNFTPQGNASIEQALSIALRMFENLK